MKFYTVDEVAKILKVSPQTIRSAIRKGRIFAVRVAGGKKAPYRIAEDQLHRLMTITFLESKGVEQCSEITEY